MSTCNQPTSPTATPIPTMQFIDPVLAEVKRKLLASPYAAIKRLECEFHEGVIVLRGNVPTWNTRQVAIALAMTVDGIERLDDRIVVR